LPLESFIFLLAPVPFLAFPLELLMQSLVLLPQALVLTARLPPLLPEGGNRLLELFDYGNRMQALQPRHSALSQHSVADLFENIRNYLFFGGPSRSFRQRSPDRAFLRSFQHGKH
jgi:hypothetical protein